MPDKETIEKAREDKRRGKSASTQAGEFVKAEMDKIRKGEHGASSAKQAIAIGLSEARRAGVDLPPPKTGKGRTKKSAKYAYDVGQGKRKATHRPKVARAAKENLKEEPHSAATHRALSRQARKAAKKRSAASRSASARKAARTKGAAGRSRAAKKGARTRARKR